MMQDPKTYYQQKIQKHNTSVLQLQRKIRYVSMLRLAIFGAAVFLCYFFWPNTPFIIYSILGFFIGFIPLVLWSKRLTEILTLEKNQSFICEKELQALALDYNCFYDGSIFKDDTHAYSTDLDVFGPSSFFQYTNRAVSTAGKEKYAQWLTQNTTDAIIEKQNATKDLAKKPDWNIAFSAILKQTSTDVAVIDLLKWAKGYAPFLNPKIKNLVFGVSFFSILMLIAMVLGLVSEKQLLIYFLIGLGISAKYLKKINALHGITTKLQHVFVAYTKAITHIEQTTFTSDTLQRKQAVFLRDKQKVSAVIKTFSKHLDALDQRNNMLLAVVLNAFFLRDIYLCLKIENWLLTHKKELALWMDTLAFFDAKNSQARYYFNHPKQVFATINTTDKGLCFTDIAHPLLLEHTKVANTIAMDANAFLVITGANMAGKSTFLRTVSLAIIMSNCGFPVSAKKAVYSPIAVFTSMRSVDSLSSGSSYFYAELHRLQTIMKALEKQPYFIVLDEILKGTNSKDKAQGSEKVIEKLVRMRATGIIATHDLSLCTVADYLPQVKNYFFNAEIKNDTLYFDYRFRPGICTSTNACFLLEKMEII